LIYDTLVILDDRGQPQPSLAVAWIAEPGNQRWRVSLRSGVSFNDGTVMDATAVAASLRTANPEWKIMAGTDTVVIEVAEPDPDLPAELALSRNAIVHGGPQPSGTGPFSVSQWVAGKHLALAAREQYWNGRPFLDTIEVDFGRNDRDQLSSLDLGRTDVAEVPPENIRRARADGRTVINTNPCDLLALIFTTTPQSDDDRHLRNALALSLDTAAINNVVLQGGGEPTGALLPNWLSGYALAFPSEANPARARQERAFTKQNTPLLLAYDAADAVSHTIAERILLNARDVGITVQLTNGGRSDAVLTRIPVVSIDPQVALVTFAAELQLPKPKFGGNSADDNYAAEKALLLSHRIIPLLHLRSAIAVRPNVRGVSISPNGVLQLENAWLEASQP
jgi:peptide/nickel transport system substrate-binding protein